MIIIVSLIDIVSYDVDDNMEIINECICDNQSMIIDVKTISLLQDMKALLIYMIINVSIVIIVKGQK
jgi:hypothetical protein